ncbi:MAG: ArsA-related P-loop ATPase [Actinomycetes bacterium]
MDQRRFCTSARVVVVAGKGGVGKTTVTAALAVLAARVGLRVLIVEVEGKSGLAAAFGVPDLTYEEIDLAPGVRGRTLTPDEALVDWLEGNGFGRIARRLGTTGILDVIATAVPGMKDILVLGKVKSIEVGGDFDLVLVDAPAAGHAVSFLTSPLGLLDAVAVGPIRQQATDVVAMLSDPSRCQVLLVTAPEETPVREAAETAFALEDRVGVALLPVVVNGIYPEIGGPDDDARETTIAADAALLDVPLSLAEVEDLAAATGFRRARRAVQRRQAEHLAAALPLPQLHLPFVFDADIGRVQVEALATALSVAIGALDDVEVSG